MFLDIEVYCNHVFCELFINYCYITENKRNSQTCIRTGWSWSVNSSCSNLAQAFGLADCSFLKKFLTCEHFQNLIISWIQDEHIWGSRLTFGKLDNLGLLSVKLTPKCYTKIFNCVAEVKCWCWGPGICH